jgi:nitrite reductase/ring-hydroxylating ferredoxin subunit
MRDQPVWVNVGRLSSLGEKRSMRIALGDEEIALWRVGGVVYAIDNVCAHQHIPALHQGTLNGLTVACPMHGWTYSLETGLSLAGNGRVRTFRVKIERDDIFVERPEPKW